MAAVTKNRYFFSCQFLLYYKSKLTQILTAKEKFHRKTQNTTHCHVAAVKI
jgi:hypothetical protein